MKINVRKKSTLKTTVELYTKTQAQKMNHFSGDYKECVVFPKGSDLKICMGLGRDQKLDLEKIRYAVALAAKKVKMLKKDRFALKWPKLKDFNDAELSHAMSESLVLTAYQFTKYKTDTKAIKELKSCDLVTDKSISSAVAKAVAIAESVCFTRDLVNEMAHVMSPQKLALEAKDLAKDKRCKVTIFDEKRIQKEGMGLLYAVGQGAKHPPRFIILEYKGDPESKTCKAVIGKGITFDTGGLNLKPSGSIEGMKQDMAGGATSLGVFKAAVALDLKVNLLVAVPAADNAIDSGSYYPGDIYPSYLGKTVQIKNTDAEGRLVLADALAYVNEHYKPECMVNLATLTGAILVCFSDVVAGLFSNDDDLAQELFHAGQETHERLWRLPLYEEYSAAIKGDVADLNNLSNMGRGHAGSLTAAAFLQEFVGDTPWAHLDIAGTAYNDRGAKGYTPKHATGFGVRLLVDWLAMGQDLADE